jgi:micrococcal nuclease
VKKDELTLTKAGLMAAVGIAALSLSLNFYLLRRRPPVKTFSPSPPSAPRTYPVTRVLDGDTFRVRPDRRVRLANLDAPELGNCFGPESKAHLEKLITGREVEIVPVKNDAYGRILGFVYLGDEFINEAMARRGWGKYRTGGGPSDQREKVKKAAQGAKADQLGVWSPVCYQRENTKNPDCLIKGNIGKSRGRKTYHFPGCNEYERTVVELDLGE